MKTELISQALKKALSFQEVGELTQAIEIYKDILQEDNTNIEACFELGNSYNKNKDYKNALFYFKEASKLDNKYYICHYNMAKIYDKISKYEFCLFHLEKTLKINPEFSDALFSMAQCYRKMKDEKNMLVYLHKTLEKQPEHPSANHLLSSLNKDTTSKYSLEYARDLFDRYAGHFENHLVNSLKYQVPFIIKEKLISLNLAKGSKVLDLGCGTGLIGKTIVDIFPTLFGVDISSNMIKETRKKEIYTELYVNDIQGFLLKNKQVFDLIIAADVFIYIGDIKTLFSYAKERLNSNGYFIFTIELFEGTNSINYQLGKSGRFSHSMDYIESLCIEIGFELIEKEEIILREENKIGQKGAIFIFRTIP